MFMEPYFYFFYMIVISFLWSKCKYSRIKLCCNRLPFVKEIQISTATNTEWRANLRRSEDSSLIFCYELPAQQLGERHPNPVELAAG